MSGKVRDENGNAGAGVKGCDVKILVVGDRRCGKTLFIKAFTKRFGNESEEADDAFEYAAVYPAKYFLDGVTRSVKVLEIADVPEDIETKLTKGHYDSNGIIFMYAIDNPSSFEALPEKWINTVESNECKVTQPSVLIGNKKDLRDDQKVLDKLAEDNQAPVTKEQGEQLKRARGLNGFYETKSTDKDDQGICDAIECIMKVAVPHWKGDTGLE